MKKWLKIVVGVLGLICVILGMNYAYRSQQTRKMDKPEITLHIQDNPLISRDEIEAILIREGLYYPDIPFNELNTNYIEKRIEKIAEVLSVKVFTHIGSKWEINITQRNPIVKVINKFNDKYYIDDKGAIIKSVVEHTARVLIANGFINERPKGLNVINIINTDSLKTSSKLDDIYRISNYVCTNPFLSAQISQLYVQEDGEIILIPQVGEYVIIFGSASTRAEVKEKFEKLMKFYKEGLKYEGWNKYKEINLKYSGQVVCKKR